jgi:hypothetical protein
MYGNSMFAVCTHLQLILKKKRFTVWSVPYDELMMWYHGTQNSKIHVLPVGRWACSSICNNVSLLTAVKGEHQIWLWCKNEIIITWAVDICYIPLKWRVQMWWTSDLDWFGAEDSYDKGQTKTETERGQSNVCLLKFRSRYFQCLVRPIYCCFHELIIWGFVQAVQALLWLGILSADHNCRTLAFQMVTCYSSQQWRTRNNCSDSFWCFPFDYSVLNTLLSNFALQWAFRVDVKSETSGWLTQVHLHSCFYSSYIHVSNSSDWYWIANMLLIASVP